MKTLSSFKYLWFIFGSSKNTSSPAPYIFFFSNTSRSEFSSITDPLEILIKIPFLPRAFRKFLETKPFVAAPPFNAIKLSIVWDSSKIYVVEDGSHSAFEKEMFSKIRKSLEEIYIS